MIVYTDIDVYTGPAWLIPMFDGLMRDNNKIEVMYTAEGVPFIDASVLADTRYNFNFEVTSPDGETRTLANWLTTTKYSYNDND